MKDAEKEPANDGADGQRLPPLGPPLTAAGKGLANFSTYSAWAASTSWCPLKMISTAPCEKRKGFPRAHQFLTANQSKETGHAWGCLSCSGAEDRMLGCGSRSLHSPSASSEVRMFSLFPTKCCFSSFTTPSPGHRTHCWWSIGMASIDSGVQACS